MNYPNDSHWFDALPSRNETFFFSIYCSIDFLHWSFHKGISGEALPLLFWRTPHISETEYSELDPCEYLSSNLTKSAHNYIFGEGNIPSIINAFNAVDSRKSKYISVYFISSNHVSKKQKELLSKLWSIVPCRQIQIEKQEIFRSSVYVDCDIHVIAMLRGAATIKGFPVLVICADKNISFAGSNVNSSAVTAGHIGLFSGEEDQVKKVVEVIEDWLTKVEEKNIAKKGTIDVVVTGDKRIMLLEKIQELEGIKEKYDISEKKYLIHYGISDVLMQLVHRHEKKDKSDSIEDEKFKFIVEKMIDNKSLRENLVGKVTISGEELNDIKCNNGADECVMGNDIADIIETVTNDKISYQGKRAVFAKQLDKGQHMVSEKKDSLPYQPNKRRKLRDEQSINLSINNVETDSLNRHEYTASSKIPGSQLNDNGTPKSYIKKRVAKRFGRTLYFGTIMDYTLEGSMSWKGLWHVLYDDGDEEDFDRNDLLKGLKLYSKNKEKDKDD